MKVIFHTNIDAYRTKEWPIFTDHVPSKGEMIYCDDKPFQASNGNKYPPRLEVCAVCYKPDSYVKYNNHAIAYVELWYNETDFKLYGGGANLLE